MSSKKGKQQLSQEEELAFLEQAAAANQAKKDAAKAAPKVAQSKKEIIELVNIPEAPYVSFPDRNFPAGEVVEYQGLNGYRSTDKELEEIERLEYMNSILPDLREAAEIHRRVRMWAMENIVKPGVCLFDMCSQIEEAVRRLSNFDPPRNGLAFPCGVSLNN